MSTFDFKAATPTASIASTGFVFGADSQSDSNPKIYNASAFPLPASANTFTTTQTITPGTEVSPLVLTGGTLAGTTSRPLISATQTWNNSGLTATGLLLNVTDSSSNAASLLMDLQVAGSSIFSVAKSNSSASLPTLTIGDKNTGWYRNGSSQWTWSINNLSFLTLVSDAIKMRSGNSFGWTNGESTSATFDTVLTRAAAASLRFGASDAASPVAQTLSVQSVVGTTANTSGVDWTLNASRGTGTGAGGKVIWQAASAGGASQTAVSVTCTNASPGVFTLTTHGLAKGQAVTLGGTAVPTGFTAGTTYFVCADGNFAANTFTLSTTIANAWAGTAVNTSSTGTSVTLTTGQNTLYGAVALTAPATLGSGATLVTQQPSVVINGVAANGGHVLPTTATDGFLYIPSCAGTPTGTPTAQGTTVPIVFDTSGVKIWIYTGGAWKGVVVA